MNSNISTYINIIEKEKELEKLKEESKDTRNFFYDINFDKLTVFLEENGFRHVKDNDIYTIWRHIDTEQNAIFLLNKDVDNWFENIERNLKLISELTKINYSDIIKRLF